MAEPASESAGGDRRMSDQPQQKDRKVLVSLDDAKTVAAAAQVAIETQPVESWQRALSSLRSALSEEGDDQGEGWYWLRAIAEWAAEEGKASTGERRRAFEQVELRAGLISSTPPTQADIDWALTVLKERDPAAATLPSPSQEDGERLRKIAYGLETGYFRDDSSAVIQYAHDAADLLRNLAAQENYQGSGLKPAERERLIRLADLLGAVHAEDADPRFHEDDARFLRNLADPSEPN